MFFEEDSSTTVGVGIAIVLVFAVGNHPRLL